MYSGVILRFALLCAIGVSFAWVNDYDRPFVFECQNNKPITVFRSRHDNPHEDRLSSFQMNASSALRLLLLCTIGVTFAWVNDYDEPFLFECPVGRPIYWFQSDHEDYYNDRIFDFQCGNYIGEPECVWSDWVNDYDEQFSYPCANNHFVSGIESTHDNYYNDRIFKFYCCEVANFTVLDCSWTPFVNTYDEDFTYVLDESRILCGVGSEHDNYYNDRRFEMYECELPSH